MIDFRGLASRVRRENLRYSTDIFWPGQLVVSGCDLNTSYLMDHATASFPLQVIFVIKLNLPCKTFLCSHGALNCGTW